MQITHALSLTVADATGTATIWNGTTTSTIVATGVPRPGDWNSQHALQFSLAGNTTNASTVSGTVVPFRGEGGISVGGSAGSLVFSAVQNATMSQTAFPPAWNSLGTSGASNGSLSIHRLRLPQDLVASNLRVLASISGNTHTSASTNTYGLSLSYGLYTLTGSTLSLSTSTTGTYSGTWSTNSTASINGIREMTMSLPVTMTPGDYYAGIIVSTSSSNASMGVSMVMAADQNTAMFQPGRLGAATAGSQVLMPGHGIFSTTTGALPSTVHVTNVNGSGTRGSRAYVFMEFRNTTLL